MLNFIVMGEVPGTQIQITFYGLLLGVLVAALIIMTAVLIRGVYTLVKKRPVDNNLISI